MKRYWILLPITEKSKVSNETGKELFMKYLNVHKTILYSENYKNPIIPQGYRYVCGKWNDGFVIERYSDGSQFVWIPVGSLDSNGTLDGNSFVEKLGRRNYQGYKFSEDEFSEPYTMDFVLQLESIKEYGGFYISRYNISKNEKTGKPQSIKGEIPWRNIDFFDTMKIAAMFETENSITSHLTFGMEYDSVEEWFIKSKARTRREIVEESTNWGHYNTNHSICGVAKTGSNEEWCTNNIYDFAGNLSEWTQEQYKRSYHVIRGGCYDYFGISNYSVDHRSCRSSIYEDYNIGFRIVLCITPHYLL